MAFAFAGSELEVDLTRGNIVRKEGDTESYRTYLGGRGIGTKICWERVSPEVEAFGEDNPLIFAAGTLDGTVAPAANRTLVMTKSPLTGLLTYSSMGGFWGPELKHAGYDTLIVSGKSPTPVYLWIDNDKVEIRDASSVWGKTTGETEKAIREELKNNRVQILAIGPAGENKVYFASIEHGTGASASRAGVGAVMGDKNLKAIAVHGTREIYIAKPVQFIELCEQILVRADKLSAWVDGISRNQIAGLIRLTYYGYFDELNPLEYGDEHADFTEKIGARRPACDNCRIACRREYRLADGKSAYLKCTSHHVFFSALKIRDFMANLRCYHLAEEYGYDSLSLAYVMAFAIGLYEKGILTRDDVDGLHLEFGNLEVALQLIEMITRRQGIGDVLARGVKEAARLIGKGADDYGFHVKGLEQYTVPFQFPYFALATAISERADVLRQIQFTPQHLLRWKREDKEAYMKEGFWAYPEEWKDYIWEDFSPAGTDYERITKITSFDGDAITMTDCTGICTFWTGFWRFEPINFWQQLKLLSYATGIDIDEAEGLRIAQRAGNALRAYNCILGERRKEDTVPTKFFRESALMFTPLDSGSFDKLIDEYYALRGWNGDGVPTKEKLNELGLGYVTQELIRKGILTDEKNKDNND